MANLHVKNLSDSQFAVVDDNGNKATEDLFSSYEEAHNWINKKGRENWDALPSKGRPPRGQSPR